VLKPSKPWTTQLVNETKVRVKKFLDDTCAGKPLAYRLQIASERLDHLNAQYENLGDSNDPNKFAVQDNALSNSTGELSEALIDLERLVLVMSTFVHHAKFGGLSENQIRRGEKLAVGLLKINGIDPARSRLAFLYSELHMVLSQIYRNFGMQWEAAWEQHMVQFFAKPNQDAFQNLLVANREFRIGHTETAIEKVEAALKQPLEDASREVAMLSLLKMALVKGDDGRVAQAKETLDGFALTKAGALECKWEVLKDACLQANDLSEMVTAVKYGNDYHHPTYLLEASLLAKCVQSKSFMSKISKITSLAKRKTMPLHRHKHFYKAAIQLEECYDVGIPLPLRVRNLGLTLSMAHKQVSVDKELMVYAAAARFLSRSKCFSFAALALTRYIHLSRSVSNGNPDALHICSDMIEKEWYVKQLAA
jgi:hypothetical protein